MKINGYRIVNFAGMNGPVEYSYDVIELDDGVYFANYTPDGIQTTTDLGFASRFPGGTAQRYIDTYLMPYFDDDGNWKDPFVGVAEAAEILGWDKRKLSVYIGRGAFAEPIQRLASGPIWTRRQIEEYRNSNAPTNR